MNFNKHFDMVGKHAFLSASSSAWVNYDIDKLESVYTKTMAVQRGTDLHELASECIRLGVKMPRTKKSFDRYVNDAIGFCMIPEQVLYYSQNAFGTADAISFNKNFLRIHDLKTGTSIASMRQLHVYTALFCLEYQIAPIDIDIELRKYQLDEVVVDIPEPDTIRYIMNKIIEFDRKIDMIREDVFNE
jgi:hypothetical protein